MDSGPRPRGRFLVLEGIDGCGKTTQLRSLAHWLPVSGLMPEGAELIVTREPGGTALGQSLRELLLHSKGDQAPCGTAELLLYAADRAQHVATTIAPALERGDWVLSDRFAGSTAAYQGFGRGLSLTLIGQLEQIATAGLQPDLTLWLDLAPELALVRRGDRPADRIEAAGETFLGRVATGFRALAEERSWCRIEAGQSPEAVAQELQQSLAAWINADRESAPRRPTEALSAELLSRQPLSVEPSSTEPRSAELISREPPTTEPRSIEPRSTEPVFMEPRSAELWPGSDP
jgi:dTMP kinase